MTAKVGEVVAVIGNGVEKAPASEGVAAKKVPQWRSPFEEVSTPTGGLDSAKGPNGIHLTPLARRLIASAGSTLPGWRRKLSERRRDELMERRCAQRSARDQPRPTRRRLPVAPAPRPRLYLVGKATSSALNDVRQKTGERLTETWRTIPHVFQAIEVDFTAVDRVRKARKADFQTAHGFSLTFLPFIARATCLAISAYPQINARFDGKALTLSRDVNLGIAVDLDHNGLVVPVVRGAGELTAIGLAKAIRRQIEKAKAGQAFRRRSLRGNLFDQQQRRLRHDLHGADHQCAASRHSLNRRNSLEARGGVDAGGRLLSPAHDRA